MDEVSSQEKLPEASAPIAKESQNLWEKFSSLPLPTKLFFAFAFLLIVGTSFFLTQSTGGLFNFASGGSVNVAVSVGSNTYTLPSYFNGHNGDNMPANHWAGIVGQKIAGLYPGTIRYPSSIAGCFNWQTGNIFSDCHFTFGSPVINTDKLEDFANSIHTTNALPTYVLNIQTSSINDQIAMLYHAQSLGLPVQFVELGNEVYIHNDVVSPRARIFSSGTDYAQYVIPWITALKAAFPDSTIGVVGVVAPDGSSHEQNWNSELRQTLEANTAIKNYLQNGAVAIVLHPYEGSGIGGSVSEEYNSLISDAGGRIFFSMPTEAKAVWDYYMNQFSPGTKFIFSEYGLSDNGSEGVFGTWAAGLFNGLMMLHTIPDSNRLDYVQMYTLEAPAHYGEIYRSDNGCGYWARGSAHACNNPPQNPKTHDNTYTTTGLVMQEIGTAMGQDTTQATELSFTNNDLIHGHNNTDFRPLIGYLFNRQSGNQAIIMNLYSDINLTLSQNQLLHFASYDMVYGKKEILGLGDFSGYPENITHVAGSIPAGSPLIVPAHAIVRLFGTVGTTVTPSPSSSTTPNPSITCIPRPPCSAGRACPQFFIEGMCPPSGTPGPKPTVTTYTLVGQVTNVTTNTGVADMTIVVSGHAGGNPRFFQVTDARGTFHFANIPFGLYDVSVLPTGSYTITTKNPEIIQIGPNNATAYFGATPTH